MKDKEDTAIMKSFPEARILYCFWHNEKTLKKVLKRAQTFACVKAMMLTDSEETFYIKVAEFRELEKSNLKNLEYFDNNLMNFLDEWTKFKRSGTFFK